MDVEYAEQRPRLSERVAAEAHHFSVGTTLLDVLLAPLWLLGWVVFWVVLIVADTGRLGFAAVRLGWVDARSKAQQRRIAVDRWPVKPRPSKSKAAAGGSG